MERGLEGMKRMVSILMALAIALGCACAQAEVVHWPGSEGQRMLVIYCEEWVSLRAQPDVNSERLAKVGRDEIVDNCQDAGNGFIACEANGQRGYILSDYLTPVNFEIRSAEDSLQGSKIWGDRSSFSERAWSLDFAPEDLHVLCERTWTDNVEAMNVSCFDGAGSFVWGLYTSDGYAAELDGTAAFAGGTSERPQVIVSSSSQGFAAIEPSSGRLLWAKDFAKEELRGGLSTAIDEDGTMYLGGYYGPDPVAISADGDVLWCSDVGNNSFWLYKISVDGDVIVADYDYLDEGGYSRVWFDRATGEVLRAE